MTRKTFNNVWLGILTLILIASEAVQSQDPYWLKSWNEAYKEKPETLSSSARIASAKEPGTPLIIYGRVFTPDGEPTENIIVHAYHRDVKGFDFGLNDKELSTWRLQGWVQTDAEGRFEFKTIRPAPDHLGREGAHIHFTLLTKSFGRQWAPTVYLSDDPKVTDSQRDRAKEAGKFGRVRDVKEVDGIQSIHVNFKLKEQPDF